MVTGVREHDGQVWLGSLHEPALAVLSPITVGLDHLDSGSPPEPQGEAD